MRKKTTLLLGIFIGLFVVFGGVVYYRFVYYPTLGFFGVITNPIEARIYIDEEFIGDSPVEFQKRAGTYHLRAEKDGYQAYEQEIEIMPGGSDVVGALLQEEGFGEDEE